MTKDKGNLDLMHSNMLQETCVKLTNITDKQMSVGDAKLASIPDRTSNKIMGKSIIPQGLGNQLPLLKFNYYLDYQI